MKAWRIEKHGGPEVLKKSDVAEPKPGPLEALIRIEAVGLNHLDLWVQKGVPGHKFPLPMIPGCDVTGEIQELGPGGTEAISTLGLKKGSGVIVNPGLSCGICEACLGGFDPLCRSYGILGETRDGGCADYVVVPVANLIPRPSQISIPEAASLGIPFLTAWTLLFNKGGLRPGDLCLIQAGGSGVSVAAIQIAKMIGAVVITTVGSDEKVEKAESLGADHVIQYRKTPFREEVKRIAQAYRKKGCEVVLDHVGADTFDDSLKCLTWGGRFVTCGATSGGKVSVDLKAVFFKNIAILGSTMGSKSDLIRIVDLVSLGKLKPVIHQTLPMNELPSGFALLEERKVFGRVVLTNV